MTTTPVRFAAIGMNHNHIYGQVNLLLRAGAQQAGYYARETDLAMPFGKALPQARFARRAAELLEDPRIHLIVSAAIPDERAALGIAALRQGKDFMSDKPGFTAMPQAHCFLACELALRAEAQARRLGYLSGDEDSHG